jgi:hypothetical protein
MTEPNGKSSVTSTNYVLGYDWGKVEAFVHDDSITVHCVPRNPPGMLYEARISRPEGVLHRERSFIPDETRSKFVPQKDCDNPAELRPNFKSMLGNLPEEIADVVRTAYNLH